MIEIPLFCKLFSKSVHENPVFFLIFRYLSTLTTQEMPMATRGLAVSKDQSREFMACFPDIVRDLTETGKHIDVPEASKWLAKVRYMSLQSVVSEVRWSNLL